MSLQRDRGQVFQARAGFGFQDDIADCIHMTFQAMLFGESHHMIADGPLIARLARDAGYLAERAPQALVLEPFDGLFRCFRYLHGSNLLVYAG